MPRGSSREHDAPTPDEWRVLKALVSGTRLRRVPREFVGRLPRRYVTRHVVEAETLVRMIARRWISDVSTSEQRVVGDAFYRVTDAGRLAHANRNTEEVRGAP